MPELTDRHEQTQLRLARLEQDVAGENETLLAQVRRAHDRLADAIRRLRHEVRYGRSARDRDRAAEAYELALKRRRSLATAEGTLREMRGRIHARPGT